MTIRTEELQLTLEQATPGPWSVNEDGEVWGDDNYEQLLADVLDIGFEGESEANGLLVMSAPELAAEVLSSRARIEALEAALTLAERFISNGIELGFIRMPDDDCPDPAHATLPAIRATLTGAKP